MGWFCVVMVDYCVCPTGPNNGPVPVWGQKSELKGLGKSSLSVVAGKDP